MKKFLGKIIMPTLNLIGYFIELLFSIPFIGRVLRWIWQSFVTLIFFVVGIVTESILWQVGIRVRKKLRVGAIIYTDEENSPIADIEKVRFELIKTSQYYFGKALIEIIPENVRLEAGDLGGPREDTNYTENIIIDYGVSDKEFLDSASNVQHLLDDLRIVGSKRNLDISRKFFTSSFRSVFGIGAPVIILFVRDFRGRGYAGMSLGWLSNYVTIKSDHISVITHEIAHVLGLFHEANRDNLMHPTGGLYQELTKWQIIRMRSSPLVTYL